MIKNRYHSILSIHWVVWMKKKYFYDNITVYKHCKVNELPYSNITYSFRYYMKKKMYTLDNIIEKNF